MCEALRELMKDEIDDEVQEKSQKAVDNALVAAIRSLMKKNKIGATEAMEMMSIPAADQQRYAAII